LEANLNGFESEQQTKAHSGLPFSTMGKLVTYQRPCCVGTIQVDDSAEVVVERDVDVQPTNDAILISKAFNTLALQLTVAQFGRDRYHISSRLSRPLLLPASPMVC
jgi:hypothetical protein